ncbi:hypothetical protein DevBK_02625 [Devosia sp. BK]|uniref:hypothetical protein n=1 Tax=Devosia sp. BK TaxID=2871706 RepID=UPI00293B858F|nr:hypothetical protein [Devosia sp. BK]MDV3250222.1 hypothetical protein [Devosia sp. BK]
MVFRATTIIVAAGLLTGPALAQDQVVIDYNDGNALDIADTAQWSPIAEKIGGGVEVLGEVKGAFTKAGADEIGYLVSNGSPAAADPFPKLDQRLVVFAGDEQVADWALPEDAAFSRPVVAVDLDGDGIDELVGEGSFYNMGTMAIGLSAVKLGDAPEVIQTLPDVYIDSCDASVGQRSIEASVVSVVDGKLTSQTTTEDCPAK